MLSKMLGMRTMVGLLRAPCWTSHKIAVKRWSDLIPPDQYGKNHNNWPNKFKMMYAMRVYWETIPLFVTTFVAIGVCVAAIHWAWHNKVDLVKKPNSHDNISRTMDLRDPTVHKIMIINQEYPPWPEMQDVLDKMAAADH